MFNESQRRRPRRGMQYCSAPGCNEQIPIYIGSVTERAPVFCVEHRPVIGLDASYYSGVAAATGRPVGSTRRPPRVKLCKSCHRSILFSLPSDFCLEGCLPLPCEICDAMITPPALTCDWHNRICSRCGEAFYIHSDGIVDLRNCPNCGQDDGAYIGSKTQPGDDYPFVLEQLERRRQIPIAAINDGTAEYLSAFYHLSEESADRFKERSANIIASFGTKPAIEQYQESHFKYDNIDNVAVAGILFVNIIFDIDAKEVPPLLRVAGMWRETRDMWMYKNPHHGEMHYRRAQSQPRTPTAAPAAAAAAGIVSPGGPLGFAALQSPIRGLTPTERRSFPEVAGDSPVMLKSPTAAQQATRVLSPVELLHPLAPASPVLRAEPPRNSEEEACMECIKLPTGNLSGFNNPNGAWWSLSRGATLSQHRNAFALPTKWNAVGAVTKHRPPTASSVLFSLVTPQIQKFSTNSEYFRNKSRRPTRVPVATTETEKNILYCGGGIQGLYLKAPISVSPARLYSTIEWDRDKKNSTQESQARDRAETTKRNNLEALIEGCMIISGLQLLEHKSIATIRLSDVYSSADPKSYISNRITQYSREAISVLRGRLEAYFESILSVMRDDRRRRPSESIIRPEDKSSSTEVHSALTEKYNRERTLAQLDLENRRMRLMSWLPVEPESTQPAMAAARWAAIRERRAFGEFATGARRLSLVIDAAVRKAAADRLSGNAPMPAEGPPSPTSAETRGRPTTPTTPTDGVRRSHAPSPLTRSPKKSGQGKE